MMLIIFSFSAKPAERSNETSLKVADRVLTSFEKVTGIDYQADQRIKVLEIINHVIRKGSHFSEYALLACTFALHLLVLKKRGKLLLLVPIILSAFYASTDEFHQLFILGRSGQVSDVILDTCGAITGSLLFSTIVILIKKHKNKKKLSVTME
jgi:VanZ family protein